MILTDDLRNENEMNSNENNVDSTLPEILTEITDDDAVKTAWGKIKKIVIDFLAHVKLVATSSVLGHVKVSDIYKSKLPEGAAADGVVASQNALYNVYNELNNNLVHMKRYIVAGIQDNFTSNSNSQMVPLDRSINNVNNGFELHDGFIKCLYDGNVQVSGASYLNNKVTATIGAGITNLSTLDGSSVQSYTQANAYPVLSIPTKILSVSKGDLLQFSYRNPNGTGDELFNTNSTFVCVKYI